MLNSRYSWSESKRASNLQKHGLDFADAALVLNSKYRLDVDTERHAERRTQSFAYVFECLAVLTVVHVEGRKPRIISFRRASIDEREIYHEWLEKDYDGA